MTIVQPNRRNEAAISEAGRQATVDRSIALLNGTLPIPVGNGLSAIVVTVTPEMAELMLAKNQSNRRIKEPRVELYARAMTDGRWHLNGEPVVFDTSGGLRSGQHRLLSCIRSGVGLERGEPVLTLRNALLNSTKNRALSTTTQYVFVVKAWNATMEGRALKVLKFTEAEGVPTIYGLEGKLS